MLLFFMMVFTLLRSNGLSSLSNMSWVTIGLFIIAANAYSSQFWQETCNKFSPIEYVESTYLREEEETEEGKKPPVPVYLPDILKDKDGNLIQQRPKYNKTPNKKRNIVKREVRPVSTTIKEDPV